MAKRSSSSASAELTASQQMVLEFIESYSTENARPPTIREIQSHCGFGSPRAVSYIIEKLEEARLLWREARSRGLFSARIERTPARFFQLPLFDSIPAGFGDAVEGTEAEMAPHTLRFVPATLGIGDMNQAFAVKVRGESMIGAGIHDGDTVILEKKEAHAGDIVAALIDGESTLKRLIQSSNSRERGYHLQAENPKFPDLVPVNHLDIQGVVVGVLRRYAEVS